MLKSQHNFSFLFLAVCIKCGLELCEMVDAFCVNAEDIITIFCISLDVHASRCDLKVNVCKVIALGHHNKMFSWIRLKIWIRVWNYFTKACLLKLSEFKVTWLIHCAWHWQCLLMTSAQSVRLRICSLYFFIVISWDT